MTVVISRRLGIRTLEPARGGGGFGGGGRGGGRDFGRRDYGSVLRLCLKSFLWVSGFFFFFSEVVVAAMETAGGQLLLV